MWGDGMPRKLLTPEVIDNINNLYYTGKTYKEIAEETGIAYVTVARYIKYNIKDKTEDIERKDIQAHMKRLKQLNNTWNKFHPGQHVSLKHKRHAPNVTETMVLVQVRDGEIIYISNYIITVQDKNGRREAVSKNEVYCGEIKINGRDLE
jgi:hypothetical protein